MTRWRISKTHIFNTGVYVCVCTYVCPCMSLRVSACLSHRFLAGEAVSRTDTSLTSFPFDRTQLGLSISPQGRMRMEQFL